MASDSHCLMEIIPLGRDMISKRSLVLVVTILYLVIGKREEKKTDCSWQFVAGHAWASHTSFSLLDRLWLFGNSLTRGVGMRLEAGVGCDGIKVWICERSRLRELAPVSLAVCYGVLLVSFWGRPIGPFWS